MSEKPAGVFQSVGAFATLGIQLALTVFVFFLLGRVLDGYFNTAPWLMIVCLFLGSAGGIIKFIRVAIAEGAKQDAEDADRKKKN